MNKIKRFSVKDEDDLLDQVTKWPETDPYWEEGWELVIPYPYLKKMINEIWNEDKLFRNVDKGNVFNYFVYKDNKYIYDKYKTEKELRYKIRNIMVLISIYYLLKDANREIRNLIFSLEDEL